MPAWLAAVCGGSLSVALLHESQYLRLREILLFRSQSFATLILVEK